MEPAGDRPPLFAGVPAETVDELLGRLDRRRFAAGTTIISEGDLLADLYIARTGAAEVLVADRHGVEHRIGRIEPGATLGEISLLTDEPATATIRATADSELIVLPREEFARFADEHPIVYRNLGATLAKRLARASRRAVHRETSRLVVLHDRGAPPLLAAALAASVAWHTRMSTLLLVLDTAPEELRALARDRRAVGLSAAGVRTDVLLADGSPTYEGEALRGMLEDLFLEYEHVLVLTRSRRPCPSPRRARSSCVVTPASARRRNGSRSSAGAVRDRAPARTSTASSRCPRPTMRRAPPSQRACFLSGATRDARSGGSRAT